MGRATTTYGGWKLIKSSAPQVAAENCSRRAGGLYACRCLAFRGALDGVWIPYPTNSTTLNAMVRSDWSFGYAKCGIRPGLSTAIQAGTGWHCECPRWECFGCQAGTCHQDIVPLTYHGNLAACAALRPLKTAGPSVSVPGLQCTACS